MKTGVIKEVGRYIVGEVVGEGSFGKVYKGVDRFDKTEVALKFISKREVYNELRGKNKKELEGLREENEMLKKISHKNIIKLLDFLETENEIIIITEFAGHDLSDILKKKKNFTLQEVKLYCKQIFDALCYLDENRIVHRDLKPQNILIQNEIIKICDFGFARKLSASTNFMNSLKGTPLYIAPEMLGSGPLNYTQNVDIWSFGIIIYELFVGRPPFYAENAQKLKPKILYEKVRFPKDMPIEMRTLIDRMLQKNPSNRASWEELKKEEFFCEKPLVEMTNFNNSNIEKLKLENPVLVKESDKECEIPEGPVRIANEQDVYEVNKILTEFESRKIEKIKLRSDTEFLEKVMALYGSYFANEGIVKKGILNRITSAFVHLMKLKTTETIANDITKRKEILFCAIKQAEENTDPETLPNELVFIGFLIKTHFDNVIIDFETDQDIIEICKREIVANRNESCLGNALTILGTMANQGILTIGNSEEFFTKIEEDKILKIIAEAYEPIPSKGIVLHCLEQFIHSSHVPRCLPKNSQHTLKKTFHNLKLQVAETLLKRDFLIYNPFTIFQEPSHVESYAKILYECIRVSDNFKEFIKNNYWVDFLKHKNLRVFCFIYDYICIQEHKVCLIPNEMMKAIGVEHQVNNISLMERVCYLARAQYYLSKKQVKNAAKQESTFKLIEQISDFIKISDEKKEAASREIEGFSCTKNRIFEEVIGQTLSNILNDVFDKNSITEVTLKHILDGILGFKPEEELKIRITIALKLFIQVEQIIRVDPHANLTNLVYLGKLISYFFHHGTIYECLKDQGPIFTKKLLISIFEVMKAYSLVDEKYQYSLFCKAEEKGLHTLISERLLDKDTLSICIGILEKLSYDGKYINLIYDFTSLTLMDKIEKYLKLDMEEKGSETIVQILHLISLVIKKNEECASKIKNLNIISHFPRYLTHNSQNLRHETLNLIGNLAKHSQYFFDDFATHSIFCCVIDTVKRFSYGTGNRNKTLKGIVYAIGNVSFYTERFSKEFTQLIPSLVLALDKKDDMPLVSNAMSTISNLLRHSNVYLKALIQNKVIKKVIQTIMNSKNADNTVLFGLNILKKALLYSEIFVDHPKSEFIALYNQKVKMVGEGNECMKKIKSLI